MNRLIKSRYLIFVILIVGLFVRLISINQSLWLDEATTALAAKMSLIDLFTKFLPGDFHPPLYYVVMHFWVQVFGSSEVLLRIPSVVFGLGTIYFTFLIAQKLFGRKTAVVSSLLLLTSGLFIYYSQEARMYVLATFLVSGAFYSLIQKKYLLLSISLFLIGMTDYVSLLIIPVFIIVDWNNLKKLFISFIPLLLGFIFWMPVFLRQLVVGLMVGSVTPGWYQLLGSASLKNVALIPVKFILGRVSFDNKFLYALIVVFAVSVFGFLLSKSLPLRVRPLKGDPLKIVWLWLVVPVVELVILSFKIPGLSYFRLLFILPAFYILVSVGVTNFKPKLYKIFLTTTLIINILSSGYYLFNHSFWREDWRVAAKEIGNDKVVFPANSQNEALTYYGKGNQIVYYKNFNGGSREVWLSRYVWNVFDPNDLARLKLENLGYNKVSENNFNGVVLWKYENRN